PARRSTHMRYALLIHETENGARPMSQDKVMEAYGVFTEGVMKDGVMGVAERLRPANEATSVRVRDGKTLVTDGPFAETKEQFGGFYILDCKTLEEAQAYAAKIPSALY